VRSVYRNLQNLETQIEISEISERNAQLSYEINLERYSNGDLSSFDLQQFQSQLSNAKLSRVNALISYKLELLNMKIQSLWDFELNEAVIPDFRYDSTYND
jgi:outer membrane protein